MIALYIFIAIVIYALLFPILVRVWEWYMSMWDKAITYIKTGTWWPDD